MGVLVWAHLALAAVAIPLTLIDLREHRLPDRFTLPLWGGSSALALMANRDAAFQGMVASAVVVAFFLMAAEWPGRPLGYGDVKLGGGLAMHLGWYGIEWALWGVALSIVSGGIWALTALIRRKLSLRDDLPFGPWLLMGTLLALIQAA